MKTILFYCFWGLWVYSFQQSSTSKLIILREKEFMGNRLQIKINDVQVADLANNRYFEIDVRSRTIKIEVTRYGAIKKVLNLTIEPQKEYYLKVYEEIDYFSSELFIAQMNEKKAKTELKTMRLDKTAKTSLNEE